MKLTYPICIYEGESSGYVAIVPDLCGCVTQGRTIEEAIEMATDAASGWVLDELEDGNEVPPASDFKDVKADAYPNGIVSVVTLDMDSYAEKYGSKSVRKNCTLPAWLNTRAENAHLNFSAILQEALMARLEIES